MKHSPKIAIIGGGLAGCAAAYVLKAAGCEVVVYEAGSGLASGASGNSVGLYNPRFGAEYNPQSRYYDAAFRLAREVFDGLEDIDFDPSGCLHLITDERKEIRFSKMLKSWGWPADEMRVVGADEASEIAGVALNHDALYLPRSGSVSPHKLCAAYADGVEVHLNHKVARLEDIEADAVILASGPALRHFEESKNLELYAVRGQVTMVRESAASRGLKCNVNYNGYMTTARGGEHMIGSTFERYAEHSEVTAGDDAENFAKLAEVMPDFAQGLEVVGSRASVRTAFRDYFPVVGALAENVYISTAHGSHGLISSILAAETLRDMILGKAPRLSSEIIDALSPQRYDAV